MDKYLVKFQLYFNDLIKDKKKLVKILVILAILMLAFILRIDETNKNNVTVEIPDSTETQTITNICVDISGEVVNPGVYEAKEGTRLYEIIEKAGGLTDDADTNSINQAKYIEDGEKIVIPTKVQNAGTTSGTLSPNSASNGNSNLININTATKEELMQLSGVGEAIAGRIIEYRSTTQFKSIEDIMCVKGIGNATFEKMKSRITV